MGYISEVSEAKEQKSTNQDDLPLHTNDGITQQASELVLCINTIIIAGLNT